MSNYTIQRGNVNDLDVVKPLWENSKMGEIESIFIEENYRKTGLGKQLMENAITWLNSQNTEIQKLSVSYGNVIVFDFINNLTFTHCIHIHRQY